MIPLIANLFFKEIKKYRCSLYYERKALENICSV